MNKLSYHKDTNVGLWHRPIWSDIISPTQSNALRMVMRPISNKWYVFTVKKWYYRGKKSKSKQWDRWREHAVQ